MSGAPLKACWPTLTIESQFWSDKTVIVEYARGVLSPILVKHLYGAPSELLKMSWDLEAPRSKAREAEEALHVKLQKAPGKAQKVIADYNESSCFKLGLQRSGQVPYEYEYRVALA
ncbi:hypothetical protein BHM03_00024971 [Ensete ventricosum]|nr:hypothetical protein BHM03_00024971 [Ensete ventricosum]